MANWYVSQKVAASGAGTSLATAKKTISEAITAAAANDTIYVYGGIYNESLIVNKILTIIGKGLINLNSGLSLDYGITITANCTIMNFKIEQFISYSIYVNNSSITINFNNCIFDNYYTPQGALQIYFNNCVNESTIRDARTFTQSYYYFNNCILKGDILLDYHFATFKFCNIKAKISYKPYSIATYNNYELTATIRFILPTSGAITAVYKSCTNIAEIEAKYLEDMLVAPPSTYFNTSKFLTAIYNNSAKGNYTLKYDEVNNPIAYATFSGNAIGAYEASANFICKDTANSGNFNIYNITTDVYGLGIFSGKTNVGVIDNVNEKLYRSSDGANNWGVFVASSELPRSHVMKNIQAFGTLIDRNGGQVAKTPSDYAYNYQIDVLVKWSATLSKTALLAETSIPFVRFRYRHNEFNYYVNNSGTLVGDGETTYLSLVNSTDGGSGSLVPQKMVAKSFVCIIILQDA